MEDLEEKMETEAAAPLVCRVCLDDASSDGLVSLFDCDEHNELLKDKYLFCSDIEVHETDPLSTHICLVCVDRLLSAYQFKQQCISSYETLRHSADELRASSDLAAALSPSSFPSVETILVKREDGTFAQYRVPVEQEADAPLPIGSRGVQQRGGPEKGGEKKKRGRPRKYPDVFGMIETSPYVRKGGKAKKKQQQQQRRIVTKLSAASLKAQEEEEEESMQAEEAQQDSAAEFTDDPIDPDYAPGKNDEEDDDGDSDGIIQLELDPEKGSFVQLIKRPGDKAAKRDKSRGGNKKFIYSHVVLEEDQNNEVDVLLEETILASSEPVSEGLLDSPSKEKKKVAKKIYKYERTHTCDQCGSSFRSNSSLQAHIRRHLGIKPFTCRLCGYSCVLSMELRRHMMRHTGVKPYKCRVCDRHFGDFGSRQKHERLHMGVRPYECNLCGKSFTYSYVLKNHMLTHTGEKKYACVPCNKKFTKAHHLKYHNKIHHKDVYLQQQLVQEAKKMTQVNISNLTTVCTEQLLGLNQGSELQEGMVEIEVDALQASMDDQGGMSDGKTLCLIDNSGSITAKRVKLGSKQIIKDDDGLQYEEIKYDNI